jgi:hypothetical protein
VVLAERGSAATVLPQDFRERRDLQRTDPGVAGKAVATSMIAPVLVA